MQHLTHTISCTQNIARGSIDRDDQTHSSRTCFYSRSYFLPRINHLNTTHKLGSYTHQTITYPSQLQFFIRISWISTVSPVQNQNWRQGFWQDKFKNKIMSKSQKHNLLVNILVCIEYYNTSLMYKQCDISWQRWLKNCLQLLPEHGYGYRAASSTSLTNPNLKTPGAVTTWGRYIFISNDDAQCMIIKYAYMFCMPSASQNHHHLFEKL